MRISLHFLALMCSLVISLVLTSGCPSRSTPARNGDGEHGGSSDLQEKEDVVWSDELFTVVSLPEMPYAYANLAEQVHAFAEQFSARSEAEALDKQLAAQGVLDPASKVYPEVIREDEGWRVYFRGNDCSTLEDCQTSLNGVTVFVKYINPTDAIGFHMEFGSSGQLLLTSGIMPDFPQWQQIWFYESGALRFLRYEETLEDGDGGGSIHVYFREDGSIERCQRWIPND